MTKHGLSSADDQCLVRLGLDRPNTLAERITRMLVRAALHRVGAE